MTMHVLLRHAGARGLRPAPPSRHSGCAPPWSHPWRASGEARGSRAGSRRPTHPRAARPAAPSPWRPLQQPLRRRQP
eukprot:scaffold34531_cov85-Phaeocystis_antarctica.AAC.2